MRPPSTCCGSLADASRTPACCSLPRSGTRIWPRVIRCGRRWVSSGGRGLHQAGRAGAAVGGAVRRLAGWAGCGRAVPADGREPVLRQCGDRRRGDRGPGGRAGRGAGPRGGAKHPGPCGAGCRGSGRRPRRPAAGCVGYRLPPSAVDEVLASGLLAADGGWLRFRHEIARLAAEQAIPAYRQGAIHARILQAL